MSKTKRIPDSQSPDSQSKELADESSSTEDLKRELGIVETVSIDSILEGIKR